MQVEHGTAAPPAPHIDPTSALLQALSLDDQDLKPQLDAPSAKPALATNLCHEALHVIDRAMSSTQAPSKQHDLPDFSVELGSAAMMNHFPEEAASPAAAAAPQAVDELVADLGTASLGVVTGGALDTTGNCVSIHPPGILPHGPAGWQASDAPSLVAPGTLVVQADQPTSPREQNTQQLQHKSASTAAPDACSAESRLHNTSQQGCNSGRLHSHTAQELLQCRTNLPLAAAVQPAAPKLPAQHSLHSLEALTRQEIASHGRQGYAQQRCDAGHQRHKNIVDMGEDALLAASPDANLAKWERGPLSSRPQSGRPCDLDVVEQDQLPAQHTVASYSDSSSAGTAPCPLLRCSPQLASQKQQCLSAVSKCHTFCLQSMCFPGFLLTLPSCLGNGVCRTLFSHEALTSF